MHCKTLIWTFLLASTLGDILGPVYPAPLDLSSSNSTLPIAWKSVTSALDGLLNGSTNGQLAAAFSGINNVTFSIGAFSLKDPAALDALQYHYTSAEVIAGNGTKSVDANSIYMVASITKVFTAFAGLLNLDYEQWNTPLLNCIPGLSEYLGTVQDPVIRTQWQDITPWDLVNQISGVAEQPPQLDFYVSALLAGLNWTDLGLPPPTEFESQSPCLLDPNCTAGQYAASVGWYHPNLSPWSSPLYSNNGFVLLGFAIANLTGKPVSEVFQESIFRPLSLSSTSSGPPANKSDLARSAYVRDSVFLAYSDIYASSGGIYSTIRDLAAFGNGILNSTLLPAKQTRKWLKPSSHTANLNYSVGAPWEIIRYTSPLTGKVTDLYTKSGQSGDTDSHFILIPDYDAGFVYLSVASNATIRGNLVGSVLDLVTASVLPALEAQAAAEAVANFVGTYRTTTLNSSVTVTFNQSTAENVGPALSVSRWISNSTDMLELIEGVPRIILSIPDQGDGKVAFQTLRRGSTAAGPFTGTLVTNGDWFLLDATRYAGYGLVFEFDVDGEGRATALTPLATKAKLERTGN